MAHVRPGRWSSLAPAVVLIVAMTSRLFRSDLSYELHIDEASYADIAHNLAVGRGLQMFGGPFHLHPPGYFLLLAGVQKAFGIHAERLELVERLRPVGAVLGALTCVLVWFLLRRVTGAVVATVAALSLAVDPFANRWDSRLMLEAPAMACATAAVVALAAAGRASGTRQRWLVLAAGAAAGCAVLTKETYVFVTVVPLLVLAATGWVLPRRRSWAALCVAAVMYATYVAVILVTGQWSAWSTQKLSGVERLIGLQQPTGYNGPGAESVSVRVSAMAVTFGGSYLLVALAAMAALTLAWRARLWRRPLAVPSAEVTVVMVWVISALAYVGYAAAFGTLEEQAFYLLLAPCIAILAVTVHLVVSRRGRIARQLVVLGAVGILATQAVGWVQLHARDDDGYRTLNAWVGQNLPVGTRVAMTEDTGQFLLERLDIVSDVDAATLPGSGADFVLVSTSLTERGYGTASTGLVDHLERSYPAVFVYSGPTLGELVLFDVRTLTGGSGVSAGLSLPSVPIP